MRNGLEVDECVRNWFKKVESMNESMKNGLIVYADGTKKWYQNGELHRLDGPAVEQSNGVKWWFQNDKLHRLDGPAIEYDNGNKCWYIEGVYYSEDEYKTKILEIGFEKLDL